MDTYKPFRWISALSIPSRFRQLLACGRSMSFSACVCRESALCFSRHSLAEDKTECFLQARWEQTQTSQHFYVSASDVAVLHFSEQRKELCAGKSCGEGSAPTRHRSCHPETPDSAAGARFPRGWSERSWR